MILSYSTESVKHGGKRVHGEVLRELREAGKVEQIFFQFYL